MKLRVNQLGSMDVYSAHQISPLVVVLLKNTYNAHLKACAFRRLESFTSVAETTVCIYVLTNITTFFLSTRN